MRNITTLFLTLISVLAYSQTISLTTADSLHLEEETTSLNDVFEHQTEIKSAAFSAAEIVWKIDSIYYPSAWELSLCDIAFCPIITDTTGTNTFTLPGKESSLLKMGYTPNGVSGSSYVRVKIIAEGTSDEPLIMIYTAKITANIESSINKISNNNALSLYPNPVTDKLYLTANENEAIQQIIIYNVIGKQVLNSEMNANTKTINVSNLDNGIYIVKMISKKGEAYSQSFVKK